MRSRNPHARETGRNVLVRCGFQSRNVTGQSGESFPAKTALTSAQYPRKGQPPISETRSDLRIFTVTDRIRNAVVPRSGDIPRDQRFYLVEHAS